jgi:TetR/AcrR family transcriptional regulator, copper-responsive repressor
MDIPETSPQPRRSAGRPRAFDREKAVEVALDLFWLHGYEGTSTSQLTAAMGISPPSLYAAFGSKDGLYREAVALYLARHGGFMAEPLAADCPAREAVSRMLQGAARQFREAGHAPGCLVSSAEIQGSPENATVVAEAAAMRMAAQRAIHARLKAASRDGELPADTDTAALAAFYAMVVQGMSTQARDGASAAMLRREAELAMRAWPSA